MSTTTIQEAIMTSMTGSCLCGQVRYTVTAEPTGSGLCHCRDCQRYTGSAFEAVMNFPTGSVTVQGGLKAFDMPGGSGQVVHRKFCPNCGSGVVVEADRRPGQTLVMVGTLDDPTVFVPAIEIFCDDAQPWIHDGSERQRYSKMPT
jgi:hypothetical protein